MIQQQIMASGWRIQRGGMALLPSKTTIKCSRNSTSHHTDIRTGKRSSSSKRRHILRWRRTRLRGGEARLYGRMRMNWRNMRTPLSDILICRNWSRIARDTEHTPFDSVDMAISSALVVMIVDSQVENVTAALISLQWMHSRIDLRKEIISGELFNL